MRELPRCRLHVRLPGRCRGELERRCDPLRMPERLRMRLRCRGRLLVRCARGSRGRLTLGAKEEGPASLPALGMHPVVPARRVELPTFALRMRCSTN
jgi:hypothetical protein